MLLRVDLIRHLPFQYWLRSEVPSFVVNGVEVLLCECLVNPFSPVSVKLLLSPLRTNVITHEENFLFRIIIGRMLDVPYDELDLVRSIARIGKEAIVPVAQSYHRGLCRHVFNLDFVIVRTPASSDLAFPASFHLDRLSACDAPPKRRFAFGSLVV